jgi:hypothetical protein
MKKREKFLVLAAIFLLIYLIGDAMQQAGQLGSEDWLLEEEERLTIQETTEQEESTTTAITTTETQETEDTQEHHSNGEEISVVLWKVETNAFF